MERFSAGALCVQSVEPGPGRGTVRVCVSGRFIDISASYLPPEYAGAFLCPGAILDGDAEAALRSAADCLSAEKAALRLIARAEQCGAGITRKLERRGHDPAAVRTVLARLLELKLVDDGRYAGLWLKSRVGRGKKGPRTLETALRAKGIDRETAVSALKEALSGDAEADLLERCVKQAGPEVAGLRFFLKREGFSSGAIETFFDDRPG
ncbi:MAG: recombination regulator RecX [Treponema sp.]|jgi:regulatory protein|nr:recombination regulator RecX [Treponema sp.]